MKVVPLDSFPFKGVQFTLGSPVEVQRSNGLLLIRQGRARLWTAAKAPMVASAATVVSVPASNLTALVATDAPSPDRLHDFPDLRPHFQYVTWRIMPHSKGTPVGSDFADKPANDPVFGVYRNCGFWTIEESRILFCVARYAKGYWLDVGGLTGWTAAHLAAAGCRVASLDPMYSNPEFRSRAVENLKACGLFSHVGLWAGTSDELFSRTTRQFSGIVIDGDHSSPHPLRDVTNASTRVVPTGFILLHDADKPETEVACKYLAGTGWTIRRYNTSHGVALCYRSGSSLPPEL